MKRHTPKHARPMTVDGAWDALLRGRSAILMEIWRLQDRGWSDGDIADHLLTCKHEKPNRPHKPNARERQAALSFVKAVA